MAWNRDNIRHHFASNGIKTKRNIELPHVSFDIDTHIKGSVEKNLQPSNFNYIIDNKNDSIIRTDLFYILNNLNIDTPSKVRRVTHFFNSLRYYIINGEDNGDMSKYVLLALLDAHDKLATDFRQQWNLILEAYEKSRAFRYNLKPHFLDMIYSLKLLIHSLDLPKSIIERLDLTYSDIFSILDKAYYGIDYKPPEIREIELAEKYLGKEFLEKYKLEPINALGLLSIVDSSTGREYLSKLYPLIVYSLKDYILGKKKHNLNEVDKIFYKFFLLSNIHTFNSVRVESHLDPDDGLKLSLGLYKSSMFLDSDDEYIGSPLSVLSVIDNLNINDIIDKVEFMSDGVTVKFKVPELKTLLNHIQENNSSYNSINVSLFDYLLSIYVSLFDYLLFLDEPDIPEDYLKGLACVSLSRRSNEIRYYNPIKGRSDYTERLFMTIKEAFEDVKNGQSPRYPASMPKSQKYRELYDSAYKIASELKERRSEIIDLYNKGDGDSIRKIITDTIESNSTALTEEIFSYFTRKTYTPLMFIDFRLKPEYLSENIRTNIESIYNNIPNDLLNTLVHTIRHGLLTDIYTANVRDKLTKTDYYRSLDGFNKKIIYIVSALPIHSVLVDKILPYMKPSKGRSPNAKRVG